MLRRKQSLDLQLLPYILSFKAHLYKTPISELLKSQLEQVIATANNPQWQAMSDSILQPSHCLLKDAYAALSYEPYIPRFNMQNGSMQYV